jgi:hypothetical protein
MIRVTITLIPSGVDDFAEEIGHMDIGCAWPLDPANQNFYIFQEMNYAELLGYDGTIQSDDHSGWWNLVLDALTQLKTNGIRREGGELFPGMLAIDPVRFDEIMKLLIKNFGQSIKSIYLVGERAKEPEKFTKIGFMKTVTKLLEGGGHITGNFLFDNYPEYLIRNCIEPAR